MPSAVGTPVAPAAEQRLRGRARRHEVSRGAHGEWSAPATRSDPVALVKNEDAGRVPALVPIRHERMAASPFAFYRGTAAIMAADLRNCPSSGIEVQSCGDCHLSNFGVFASPERRLVFDINDFDETAPAPFEWDVKRLAASFVLAARHRDFGEKHARRCARSAVRQYQEAIARDAVRPLLDVWYQGVAVDDVLAVLLPAASKAERKQTERGLRKAHDRTNVGALAKFAEFGPEGWRIRPEPPLIVRYERSAEAEESLRALFAAYSRTLAPDRRALFRQYRLVDFARKVVGVGSVGTEAFMFLFMGPQGDDPLFLQLKEAQPSVLASPGTDAGRMNQGRRVVEGQRLMQAASDVFLGWARGGPRGDQDFYVRQLRDMKGSADLERISAEELLVYAALCGETLARAHARSGKGPEIAGYLGTNDSFERAIARFAVLYADQAERDYAAFEAARSAGVLEMHPA